jgi:hypothetical protein
MTIETALQITEPMRPRNPPTVDNVQEISTRGPWPTKSNGVLSVPLTLSHLDAMRFLQPEPVELARLPFDISGLRIFVVDDVPRGGIGGKEFHRIRTAILFTINGKIRWICEDLYGSKREFAPSRGEVLIIPPFILHTMKAEEPGSTLVILANMLFIPEDPGTHDSYSSEVFSRLQAM